MQHSCKCQCTPYCAMYDRSYVRYTPLLPSLCCATCTTPLGASHHNMLCTHWHTSQSSAHPTPACVNRPYMHQHPTCIIDTISHPRMPDIRTRYPPQYRRGSAGADRGPASTPQGWCGCGARRAERCRGTGAEAGARASEAL